MDAGTQIPHPGKDALSRCLKGKKGNLTASQSIPYSQVHEARGGVSPRGKWWEPHEQTLLLGGLAGFLEN